MLDTEPSRTKHKTIQKLFLYPEESYLIRGACFNIYKVFRNTQKESVYQKSLFVELKSKSLFAEREKQFKLGFLVNFGEANGVKIIRRVNGNINSA